MDCDDKCIGLDEICDVTTQCSNGIDEKNCGKFFIEDRKNSMEFYIFDLRVMLSV